MVLMDQVKLQFLKVLINVSEMLYKDFSFNPIICETNLFSSDNVSKIEIEFLYKNNDYVYELHIENKTNIAYECLTMGEKSYKRDSFINLSNNQSLLKLTGVDDIIDDARNFLMRIIFISSDKVIHRFNAISWGETLEKHSEELVKVANEISCIRPVNFVRNDENSLINVDVYFSNGVDDIKLNYYKHLSSGTRDFYETLALILEGDIKVWVIDEIEKTFHPDLLIKLLKYIV